MVMKSLLATRRLLPALNAVLAAATAACAVAAFLPPAVDAPRPTATQPARDQAESAAGGDAAPLAGYAAIWSQDLRRPLFDPKPVKQEPVRPRLEVELVGAVVEPNAAYGIFRTKAGQDVLAGVGEEVAGAKVVSIEEGKAVLELAGQTFTLTVPAREGPR